MSRPFYSDARKAKVVLLLCHTFYFHAISKDGWMDGVEFNAPLDTVYVISEAVFTANHLTDTDKQNSTGKYR